MTKNGGCGDVGEMGSDKWSGGGWEQIVVVTHTLRQHDRFNVVPAWKDCNWDGELVVEVHLSGPGRLGDSKLVGTD